MRTLTLLIIAAMFATVSPQSHAQRRGMGMIDREKEFLQSTPLIGDELPNVEIYSADGTPFRTADLRGHYSVLTFGCLT